MSKYGDDSDLEAPEDLLTPVQLAWRRNQNDVEQDRDVAYDSDDPAGEAAAPEWKPKELKHRLLGFAFPIQSTEITSEDETKDKVIRYMGLKKASHRAAPVNADHENRGGPANHPRPSSTASTGPAPLGTKLKRKRKPTSQTQPSVVSGTSEHDSSWPAANYHHQSHAVPVE